MLEYADGYSSKVERPNPAGLIGVDSDTIDDSRWSIDFAVNAKAILPLGRFEPYVSGGIGFLYMNELSIEELEIRGIRHHLMQADLNYYAPSRERRPSCSLLPSLAA